MRRAWLAGILLCAACPSGLEEQSHVSKLRVLAVRHDPPELVFDGGAPPATTLTALAVTPDGGAESVRYALCTQITGAPSPTLPCPGDAGIDLPDAGPLSARLDLSDRAILALAASAQIDGGIPVNLDDGVPLVVGFRATAGSDRIEGFENLTLRSAARGPTDANPVLLGVDLDVAEPIPVKAKVRLTPVTAPKDDPGKKYGFSFFSTGGSVSSLRSTDTTASGGVAPIWVDWTAPDVPQTVRLWVVLRDGRSGVDWFERDVEVR
jgi:hypothetical protein